MNPVPELYRNVINPWQTPREIRNAVKFINQMCKARKFSMPEIRLLLGADKSDRKW